VPTTTKSTLTQPSGCETSSTEALLRREKSILEASLRSELLTSRGSPNATSSQALPAGLMPCDLPDGRMTDLFGQEAAPANPSPQPEKAKHQAMNATSGPTGLNLSELADRQSSLANRLKRQLDGVGSTLFTLTWRKKATPLGRPYYQLAASGRRISDSDCGSWATPTAQQANGEPEAFLERKRRSVARGSQMGVSLTDLQMQAKLASWATPNCMDHLPSGNLTERKTKGGCSNLKDQVPLASWPTPNVPNGGRTVHHTEGESTTRYYKGKKVQVGLESVASWATPTANDWKGSGPTTERKDGKDRTFDRLDYSTEQGLGPISSGSPAQTESRGQLNPAFSLWLMGYPEEWLNSAPPATRSSRKSRQSS
jgi:hypothetical protein